MENGTKIYTIKINGLTESIDLVKSLNDQLNAMDVRLKAVENPKINISSSSTGGGGGSRTGELSDEDKLLKQIEATQSKINQADMADYKVLLDKKNELKELVKEQKSMTAEARLSEGAYENTMLGMKQHLADIKAAMQTVDLGDTDTFEKLTKDANELNAKLLEIEKSYGQFGRNVGNYASAAEGFKGLKITVGDTVMEFDNARQALKALKQEMQTLSTKQDMAKKGMGIFSEEEAKRLEDLIPTVKQLESSIQDAGKPMDKMMDTMQSIVALAQAGKGLASFFGLDGSAVEESIKKLVALQNVMQSLQTIQKQLQTQEGFGKYFSKANSAIDAFVNKLFGVKNASNEAAKAEKAQATATTQLGNTSKSATVAVKGLSMAIKAIGIGLLIGLVSKLVDAFSNLFKKSKESEDAIKGIDAAVAGLDRQTNKLMEKYDRLFNQGTITSAQRLTEQIKLQAEYTENLVAAMRQRQLMDENSNGVDFGDTIGDKNFFGISVRNIEDVKKEWKELQKSILNGDKQTYLDALNAGKTSAEYWIEGFKSMSGELDDTSKEILNDFIGRTVKAENELKKALKDVENGVEGARDRVKKAQQTIKDLEDEMNSDEILNSILANMDKLIPDEKVRKACMNILESLGMITRGIEEEATRTNKRFHDLLIGLLPEQEQELARAKEQYEQDLEELGANFVARAVAAANYQKEVERINKKYVTNVTTTNKEILDVEKDLNNLRMKNMKDGLNKRLIQLEEERRQTLNKLKDNDKAYLEAERIFEERRRTLILEARRQLAEELAKLEDENSKNRLNNEKQRLQNEIESYNLILSEFGEPPMASVTPRYNFIPSGITTVKDSIDDMYLEVVKAAKETMLVENEYVGHLKENLRDRVNLYTSYAATVTILFEDKIKEKYKALRESLDLEEQAEKDSLLKQYQAEDENYYKLITRYAKYIDDLNKERDAGGKFRNEQDEKDYNKAKKDLERALSKQVELRQQYEDAVIELQKNYKIKRERLKKDEEKENSSAEEKIYRYRIEQYRNFISDLNSAISQQPITNDLGIVNLSKSKKNYEEIRKAALATIQDVQQAIDAINGMVKSGLMDEDTAKALISQLIDIANAAGEVVTSVDNKASELIRDFADSINEKLQTLAQAASQIMSSISEITSNSYEKQIDEQQKFVDKYSDLLDKQKEKTQEYADAVDSIEDELSSARGDRRSYLIDQLNAEIQAQRESLAEQKRIEKEKEKAEKRKAELEYKQALAEKNMSVAQAMLNAVMAVSNAAVNKWPTPAIPMMALAAAVGAAQVAAAKSQYIPKPSYGDGGVIVGKAHKDGGVPVLGGQAEVEGGEFITNKRTTSQNTPLLEYINSKKKRIDLADMVEFFNDKPRKTIKAISSKFETGGTLPSNIDIREQLQNVIINQDNRPIYVSVVDINNKQADVRRVQALAGL